MSRKGESGGGREKEIKSLIFDPHSSLPVVIIIIIIIVISRYCSTRTQTADRIYHSISFVERSERKKERKDERRA